MRVKTSTLAGSWYPGEARELRRMVEDFLACAPAPALPSARAVVVPHAGYRYSGAVAAAGYRVLPAGAARVVILAPSHRVAHRGVAVLPVDALATPLGQMRVDRVVDALVGRPLIQANPRSFEGEHSLEIQIPFLQCVVPEAAVVPMLFGHMTAADHEVFAATLAELAGERTVFVVSSDFTHYGWRFDYEPFPAHSAEQVRAALRELDMAAINLVLAADARGFADYVERSGATICGHTPISALLTWLAGRARGTLLDYRTSLDVSGEYEHVVSYAAIGFGH